MARHKMSKEKQKTVQAVSKGESTGRTWNKRSRDKRIKSDNKKLQGGASES